ncbi:hypothetical protein EVAR_90189_1 [Eumeta japonica]|uniref:Uncharacterized protein n=1 Tax=Eumeta variegata TaxID=151549 RepID=A0A4C1WYH6_EUMVA|nr:hypothetical protein EVAR_90189_1 [Eumeta japonica]
MACGLLRRPRPPISSGKCVSFGLKFPIVCQPERRLQVRSSQILNLFACARLARTERRYRRCGIGGVRSNNKADPAGAGSGWGGRRDAEALGHLYQDECKYTLTCSIARRGRWGLLAMGVTPEWVTTEFTRSAPSYTAPRATAPLVPPPGRR